jgi:hypothetical protein
MRIFASRTGISRFGVEQTVKERVDGISATRICLTRTSISRYKEHIMNDDADTGRWQNVPKLDVCTDRPERAAGSNFEHIRRAEAVPASLR